MDKNQGYEIIKAVMLENGRGFALGHNPAAPSPYVTWACYDDKDGQRQYEWGHYGSDRAALECIFRRKRAVFHRRSRFEFPLQIFVTKYQLFPFVR